MGFERPQNGARLEFTAAQSVVIDKKLDDFFNQMRPRVGKRDDLEGTGPLRQAPDAARDTAVSFDKWLRTTIANSALYHGDRGSIQEAAPSWDFRLEC